MQASPTGNDELLLERKNLDVKDFRRFLEIPATLEQFSRTYVARLRVLKSCVERIVRSKWGTRYPIFEVLELDEKDETIESCVLVGTIYKHQELKPSILKQMSEELQLEAQPARADYCSFRDSLYLEDDVQRIKLAGNFCIDEVVTGIVCAVLGHDLKNGTFWVDDWCFPGLSPKMATSLEPSRNDGKILLLSGLDFANSADSVELNVLGEWITGMAGDEAEQREMSRLVAVVIAGNSIKGSTDMFTRTNYSEKTSNSVTKTLLGARRFDEFLSEITKTCKVILMPGEFDPSSHMIPQQPIHPQILSKSSRFETFYNATNPWTGSVGSRLISGSSGQPISDIMKVANLRDATPATWLEKTLIWRLFAPTSPDTLDAHPYSRNDPLVMDQCPDIYFAGNMDRYETKFFIGDEGQKVRLICVPRFSVTKMAVLVELDTLDAAPITFGIH